jgi:DNA-binding response OmpR family regulator
MVRPPRVGIVMPQQRLAMSRTLKPHAHVGNGHHVLVIEDEPQMRTMLTDNLSFDEYRVTAVESAEDALLECEQQTFSLLLIDVMLPGMSGFELCKRLRDGGARVPMILLTARTHELDRIHGLDIGADDYVSKPFSMQELLARIRAQVRRDDRRSLTGEAFSFGDVTVHLRQQLVMRKGKRVRLSSREFELLRYLIAHQNEIVSREQLLRDVWGYHQLSVTRTVDNYVAKLRTQLEPRPNDPRYIITVHGSGYQLIV